MTGHPLAWASTAVSPKSSAWQNTSALARRYTSRSVLSSTRPSISTVGPARPRSASNCEPWPAILSLIPVRFAAWIASSVRLYGSSAATTANQSSRATLGSVVNHLVRTGG